MTPGKHGFHIHTESPTEAGCASTGKHYNPNDKPHGGPNNPERHVGDLGNIEADAEGNGKLEMTDKVISLDGDYSIIGRAVVIHAKEDDLGITDPGDMGNAGPKVACGGITQDDHDESGALALKFMSIMGASFALFSVLA